MTALLLIDRYVCMFRRHKELLAELLWLELAKNQLSNVYVPVAVSLFGAWWNMCKNNIRSGSSGVAVAKESW